MRSSSQLLLLFLLNLIVLCFGQQTPVDGTQYKYYTPKDEKDFPDSKMDGILHQEGDQWKLDLNGAASNEPLNIVLFMDQNHSMEFTLAADDLNAIAAKTGNLNEIYLTLENNAKEIKKIMVQWQGQKVWGKKRVKMTLFIEDTYVDVGMLDPSNSASPRFLIDYEGNVTAEFDGTETHKETNHTLLPNGQSSANYTVSISWTNLESAFTISFPSSIFRARRPLPPPSTTSTSTSASYGGGSSTEAPANNTWIIVVGCVFGVLILLGVAFGIWYYRKKRSNRMKSYVETIPIGPAK